MRPTTRQLPAAGLAICLVAGALAPSIARALETDQYVAWGVELDDSREPLNAFVNREIEKRLERINRRGAEEVPCEALPPVLFKALFRTTSIPSRLRRFLSGDESVDRYPDSEVGYWGYLNASLFRAPAFPFVLPMARTIRIGEVHTGTDKIGHLFGFGRRYHKRYRRALARGLDEDQALRRVVTWGVKIERYIAGGIFDGVFSFADVEANYQGLRMALAMCGESDPHLVRDPDGWRLARPLDLGRYVTTHLDESYYNSRFSDHRWKSIRPILESYCPRYHSEAVRARRERYAQLQPPSPSMRIVNEIFTRRGDDRRQRQSIDEICGPTPQRLAGVP